MPGYDNSKVSHSRCPHQLTICCWEGPLSIRAIPSAYHMVIKFPIANGVGMVRGNQCVANECYSASMKQKMVDNIYTDELDMRDEVNTRPEPS